jgi:hypothetical protein
MNTTGCTRILLSFGGGRLSSHKYAFLGRNNTENLNGWTNFITQGFSLFYLSTIFSDNACQSRLLPKHRAFTDALQL